MKLSLPLISALAPTVLAWDISKRECRSEDLCLQSFLWCPPDGGSSCSYPPDAYPLRKPSWSRTVNAALLLSDGAYTLSWKKPPHIDDPVTVVWSFGNDTSWETNATGTELILEPGKILSSFPTTQYPNVSSAEAWYAASQQPSNTITISLPSRADRHGRFPSDFSQQFIVEPGWMRRYLDIQATIAREEEHNKWRLGVGVGVGVGVPVLLVLTAFVTWRLVKGEQGTVTNEKHAGAGAD